MSKFVIQGGKKLAGEIQVSGSKNAVFPLFAAALLTDEECRFTNTPNIRDKQVMAALIADLGAEVDEANHAVTIRAQNIIKTNPNPEMVGKLRGSIVLLGALLGRLKQAELPLPGGDRIGARSIDSHIQALKGLGVQYEQVNDFMRYKTSGLTGAKIVLEESSVLATENTVLAAVLAKGTTIVKLAAMEPHVQQLCHFLNKMGGKISGIGTTTITIEGVAKLHGAEIELIPDSNEAASFITLAAATRSDVKIGRLNPDFLDDLLVKLKKMKVNFEVGSDFVRVLSPIENYVGTKIQCGLYPKLPSDDVPPLAVLATQAQGESLVYEWLYENRLGYVDQLTQMGANAEILDQHQVKILGPTPLYGKKVNSYDIRMGMTLIIAAFVAAGTSEIGDIHHIDRGYENLEERLSAIGADIKRVE